MEETYDWIKDTEFLVLFSQDCDLLNSNLENEPFAEFFCALAIERADPSLVYGKNPRKIHVPINKSLCLCLSINHRIRIKREFLANISLQNPMSLPDDELTNLLTWVSKKYSRPAFPDRFNNLLSTVPKLDKKLKKLNDEHREIKRLFFLVSPFTEIEDNQYYTLQIKVLLVGCTYDDCDYVKDAIIDELRRILSIGQIKIINIDCSFENEMTLFELSHFKEWDKDYISRRFDLVL